MFGALCCVQPDSADINLHHQHNAYRKMPVQLPEHQFSMLDTQQSKQVSMLCRT
jgi:hypothetical protein